MSNPPMTTTAPGGRAAMEPVDSYLASVLSSIRPIAARELSLSEADGAALTSDITASWPLPPFDNSAMDGYAVLAADVATASEDAPVTLPVRGEVPAGDTRTLLLIPGSCLRIMTGALLPAGADAVLPVEWTDGGTRQVTIRQPAARGNAVKRTGDDAAPGDV